MPPLKRVIVVVGFVLHVASQVPRRGPAGKRVRQRARVMWVDLVGEP